MAATVKQFNFKAWVTSALCVTVCVAIALGSISAWAMGEGDGDAETDNEHIAEVVVIGGRSYLKIPVFRIGPRGKYIQRYKLRALSQRT